MVDKEIVQRELDQIATYKEAMTRNMQYFLRHLVRGRAGHRIVFEIEREGLSPVQQRYGLAYEPSKSQNGIDINNLEELAKEIYIPRMFLDFQQFPVFSYDDRNGLFELEDQISRRKSAEMLRLSDTIAPASDKLTRLADDSTFRQDCLRYSELYVEVQLGRLKNTKLLQQVKTEPDMVRLLTDLGKTYLSELRS